MAIIKCPECQKEISDTVKKCIYCGFKIPKEKKPLKEKIVSVKNKIISSLSDKQKRIIKFSAIGVASLILLLVLFFLFISPKTVSWLCVHKKVAATCVEDAYCSRCNKKYEKAFGHTVVVDEKVKATCTAEGKTEGSHCSVCNAVLTEQQPIKMLDHKWKKATCTTPKKCSTCGKEEGKAAGHSYKEATCTAPKTCSKCGEKKGNSLGHSYKDYICTRCGDTNVKASDVPNILDMTNLRYHINYVDGIEWTVAFKNKSSKTINYIYFTFYYYNSVGDVIYNDVGGGKFDEFMYTGPLKPGASSGNIEYYAGFYNSTFGGTLSISEIIIVYSDGTELVLNEDLAKKTVVSWR